MRKNKSKRGIDMEEMNKKKIANAVREILEAVGENPDREGLLDTPMRVARMYEEVFSGLKKDPSVHFNTVFEEQHEELVLVRDIRFSSMCEHHLVPFFGVAHVAYLPQNGRVAGLSKLARVVDDVSKRPQLQERITTTVAETMMDKLNPLGVMVVLEAEHMCMTIRGVNKPGAKTITSAVRGAFRSDDKLRSEVMSLINHS
ncbi:GTP cyclohydrolase I FolE [Listeria fleischmannii]|jgi:GTP cyclohydrolase I|uniref:GTP cyclohydrolase 1 n=2 Tax=Listeria fleischmannii TaxID=1069827 RepID=A0A841YDI7_9LIST|nr:GTP cyclohydrolase I FolE [Listeria fleischmannii]MBC1418546.1 GTP cyclohydrolase I FolE [Listeria fleischmannii]MBC1426278.1 GTP cyclohydrolase I FolE [Listeria fleischmannii]